jgi:hypothetical protein
MDIQAIDKQWKGWVKGKTHIQSKLSRDELSKPYQFLNIHATTEAALRRVLFVGLRLHKVTYKNASNWLNHNDLTPGKNNQKGTFIYSYDKLYSKCWETTLKSVADFEELWELWNGFSKGLRNQLAHGLRQHSDDQFEIGIAIDQLFILRLDEAMTPFVGGSLFAGLDDLSPRLPRGDANIQATTVLEAKRRNPQLGISYSDAVARVGKL